MVKPTLFFTCYYIISCHKPKTQPKAMVIVHGGAGYVSTDLMLLGEEDGFGRQSKNHFKKVNNIWQMEARVLKRCELQSIFIEDSPHFNAGKGLCLPHLEPTNWTPRS